MFGRTTITNLQEGLLWLHTLVAVFYLVLTLALLRRFASGIPKDMTRHVLLVYYPFCKNKGCLNESTSKKSFEQEMKEWIENERVGREYVEKMYLCYDVVELEQVYQLRECVEGIMEYYQKNMKQETKIRKYMKSLKDSLQKVIDTDLFKDDEKKEKISAEDIQSVISKLKDKEKEIKDIISNPLHSLHKAFVIMQTESAATRILRDFNTVGKMCWCGRDKDMKVERAVHPTNVNWKNLSLPNHYWWMCIVTSVLIFILLLLLSTPSIIITTMDNLNISIPFSYVISPTIKQFFPTLLLWVLSSLLPVMVYHTTLKEPHWTRSSENMSMLIKLYIFLLIMVLLLPSFDLTSMDVIHLLSNSYEERVRFECIFLPDQGAFFVNYVITSTLSGGAIELLWFPLTLLCSMLRTRLPDEREHVKQQKYEFPFGAMYAWYLNVFTVIMAYSITCPIIVPIGFAYLLLKHYVDRHNLFYARQPSHIDRQVHLGAVKLALCAPIICLLWLYLFSSLQEGFIARTSLFTLMVLCITTFIYIAHSCYGLFNYFCPFNCREKDDEKDEAVLYDLDYRPLVLQDSSSKQTFEKSATCDASDRDPHNGLVQEV